MSSGCSLGPLTQNCCLQEVRGLETSHHSVSWSHTKAYVQQHPERSSQPQQSRHTNRPSSASKEVFHDPLLLKEQIQLTSGIRRVIQIRNTRLWNITLHLQKGRLQLLILWCKFELRAIESHISHLNPSPCSHSDKHLEAYPRFKGAYNAEANHNWVWLSATPHIHALLKATSLLGEGWGGLVKVILSAMTKACSNLISYL